MSENDKDNKKLNSNSILFSWLPPGKPRLKYAVILGLLLVLVVGALYFYLRQTEDDGAQKVGQKVTFQEKLFMFQAPQGWLRSGAVEDKYYFYNGPNEEYFRVGLNEKELKYVRDSLWDIEVSGKSLAVTSESKFCQKSEQEPLCAEGDKLLDILAAVPGDNPNTLPAFGGGINSIYFGNLEKESGVNLEVFREIIKSFRLK